MTKNCLLIACGLYLAGCAIPPSSTEKQAAETAVTDSIALQVMKANGYSAGLKDVEVDSTHTFGSNHLDDTLNAFLLREHLLGRATPIAGVSNTAMSAFFVLELFNDQTYLPRHGMWMPVWMPHNLARSPLEAQIRLTEIIEHAVAEALPAEYRSQPYEWTDKAIFGAESSYRMLRIDGPLCEEWSCVIRGSLSSSDKPEKSFRARMAETKKPPFVSNRETSAYRYQGLGGIELLKVIQEYDEEGWVSGHWHRVETEPLKGFDHSGFYRRLSAALPDWAFIYFGPENTHNEAGIPFVLNSGRELLFVKPKASAD